MGRKTSEFRDYFIAFHFKYGGWSFNLSLVRYKTSFGQFQISRCVAQGVRKLFEFMVKKS